jgi:hypothetical protein
MPSKTISKKSPVRVASDNNKKSLIDTLSTVEIDLILNFRLISKGFQPVVINAVHAAIEVESKEKSRPVLSIVRPPAHTDTLNSLRHLGFGTETASTDLKILLQAIFEKIDQLNEISPPPLDTMTAINCFTNCALSCVETIREKNDQAQGLILDAMKGGCHAAI